MNPYIYPAVCCICGGECMLHVRDIGTDWLTGVRHRDPAICAENLRCERTKLEKQKKELEDKKKE